MYKGDQHYNEAALAPPQEDMMLYKRLFLWIVFGLLTSATAAPAVMAQANPLESIMLSGGFRQDHILYYHPISRPQDNADARTVAYALNAAVPVYQPLFGGSRLMPDVIPFQIVFNLTGQTNGTAVADAVWLPGTAPQITALTGKNPPAAPLDASVCFVNVYAGIAGAAGAVGSSTNADLDMAHEIAHCYQSYYIHENLGGPPTDWWVEGGANWLASLVYQEQAPPGNAALFNYRLSVLENSYSNYYFWQFLASPQGLGSNQAAVDFMKTMPDANSIAQFPAALDAARPGTNATRLFHDWAMALLNRSLTYPFNLNEDDFPVISAAGSTSTTLQNPRFSVGYTRIQGFQVEAGNKAFIQVSGTDNLNYLVSVRGSEFGLVELTPDQPFAFCPPAEGITLIHSRGNGGEGAAPFQVTWGQTPSDKPCTPTPTATPNACIVGNWQVVEYPPSVGLAGVGSATVNTDDFIFSFAANGSITGSYTIQASSDGVNVDVDVPFSGSYALRAGNRPGEFVVTSVNLAFETGGIMTVTAPDGTQTDLTDAFYSSGPMDLWAPDGSLTCEGDTLSWDTVDGAGDFVLTRRF
jgi:hypothetical protein